GKFGLFRRECRWPMMFVRAMDSTVGNAPVRLAAHSSLNGDLPMLSNLSPFATQGLAPQFSFGLDPTQAGLGHSQYPFGQYPFGGQTSPYAQNPYAQNPYAQSPYAQGPFASLAASPHLHTQLAPVLTQIAQQIAVQSALTQQMGAALHQLAHQL